ncbi:MAG: F0F1 ATP synthase subunit B [Candidatus Komeilibacteria bacterium]|nr:F0F1 ATP synthase subunit B [Candidatus Komeilibacteria bacterium]
MEILDLFGVDWKLMLAQLINFGIVAFVLWRWALRPLMKTMDERKSYIEKGIADAQTATDSLQQAKVEAQSVITIGQKEAGAIIAEAKKLSEDKRQASLEQTKVEVQTLVKQAKEQIQQEKKVMLDEAKSELMELVAMAAEKIVADTMSPTVDKKFIDKMIKENK